MLFWRLLAVIHRVSLNLLRLDCVHEREGEIILVLRLLVLLGCSGDRSLELLCLDSVLEGQLVLLIDRLLIGWRNIER